MILSTSVYLKWPGSTINIGAQAQQLASDIRYTQSLSMTKNQRYRFTIISTSTYQIMNSSGSPVRNAMGALTTTLNNGITFGSLTNLPNNLIAFDGNGNPYTDTGTPGTLLASSASIPLVSGSNTQTLVISPQTGRVLVQ